MYSFYTQTNSSTFPLIPYFKVTTGRKKKHTLTHFHIKSHISNKITSTFNHSLHSIKVTILFDKAIILLYLPSSQS